MNGTLTERIRQAASPYLDGTWKYPPTVAGRRGPSRVAYTPPLPGLRVAQSPDERHIDCSSLTASILMRVFASKAWTPDDYADVQVFADRLPAHPDSPIRAMSRLGVGAVVDDFLPEAWHLVQAWAERDPWRRGHAFLVFDRGNGRLDVLESSSIDRRGPGWRTTSADALRARYPAAIYLARLHE